MKKLLLFLLLVSLSCYSKSIFRSGTYAVLVIDKQYGTYYGDPIVRHLVNSGKYSGAVTIYVDPTRINTRSEKDQIIRSIMARIGHHKPLKIFIPPKYESVKQRLLEMYGKGSVQILRTSNRAERNSQTISKFVKQAKLDYEFMYILHDNSEHSEKESSDLQDHLIKNGIDKSKIKLVEINSFQEIRMWLLKQSKSKKSVILNKLFILKDLELSTFKFINDIKKELIKNNNSHFDVGFHIAEQHNEILILTDNQTDLYEHAFLGKDVYIDTKISLNQERAKRLGYSQAFVNAFHKIDGLINK